jgi:hypothetical protein
MNQNTLFENYGNDMVNGKNILPKDGGALFFPQYFSKEDSDRLFNAIQNNIQWKQDEITLSELI